MPKLARELTAIEISRLKTPGLVAVGGVPGLQLQITPSGARSWVLRTKVADKRRDMGLGGYPAVTLAQAREKARHARELVEAGQDPILGRQRALSALRAAQASEKTFQWCAEQFIDAHGDAWRNGKHRQQWTNTLTTYAYPHVGQLLVRDVTQANVLALLQPIWKDKTETAKRLRGRIEQVLEWAKARHYRDGENPARWQGGLKMLLPAPGKIQVTEHHPAVPVDEIGAFYAGLQKRDGLSARALELALLCASRSGEVRGAEWAEFDFEKRLWTVPASRMKAGVEHRVPLSDRAIDLLRSIPSANGSVYVFPAPRGGMLSDMALTAVMRRMESEYVPHGLRSTFRDWAAERTNFPRDLAEKALAHKLTNAVEAAYQRGDMLEKRRVMMEAWAGFVTGQVHEY